MAKRPTIFIAGSGGIGRALSLLLRNEPRTAAATVLGDIHGEAVESALQFANVEVPTDAPPARGLVMPSEGTNAELDEVLASADAILDCSRGARPLEWPGSRSSTAATT